MNWIIIFVYDKLVKFSSHESIIAPPIYFDFLYFLIDLYFFIENQPNRPTLTTGIYSHRQKHEAKDFRKSVWRHWANLLKNIS